MKKLGPVWCLAVLGACSATSNTPVDGSADARSEDARSEDVEPDVRVVGPWPADRDVVVFDAPQPNQSPPIETERCVPGAVTPCVCPDLREGLQACFDEGVWLNCMCEPAPPPSTATGARLLWPLSGTRVTSLRPTLRWVLPSDVTRARVELCDDRPCSRSLQRVDVSGTSWRSAMSLRPGVVFWRVSGLREDGAVAWTSATWEFRVGRRDTPTDNAYGGLKDFNGDGYDDVVVLLTTRSRTPLGTYAPAAWSFPGGAEGISPTPVVLAMGGSTSIGELATGDLNGDGLADLFMLEARDDLLAVVRFGSREALLSTPRSDVVRPIGSVARFSWHATIAEVTGDGFDDLLLVELHRDQVRLRVYAGGPSFGLMSTPLDWRITIDPTDLPNGIWPLGAIAVPGDVDGDGYADAVIAGIAMTVVVFGPLTVGGTPRSQVLEYGAMPARGAAGGDFNGDLRGDVAFGASLSLLYAHANRMALVYRRVPNLRAPPTGVTLEGAIGTVGDVDGDGRVDLSALETCSVVGADGGCAEGRVRILRGAPDGLLVTPWWQTGAPASDQHAIVGDVNGDGFDDLVYGNCSLNIHHGGSMTPTAQRAVVLSPCTGVTDIH